MPLENESSTVEWQSAQVIPTFVNVSLPLASVVTVPWTPTTALSFSKATVVAGLVRLMVPSWIPCTTEAGSAVASTLRPTESAVVGSTAVEMTVCICNTSVHRLSSPKVSKRKVCWPAATLAGSLVGSGVPLESLPQPAAQSGARVNASKETLRIVMVAPLRGCFQRFHLHGWSGRWRRDRKHFL